jgi:hypothetical protein
MKAKSGISCSFTLSVRVSIFLNFGAFFFYLILFCLFKGDYGSKGLDFSSELSFLISESFNSVSLLSLGFSGCLSCPAALMGIPLA